MGRPAVALVGALVASCNGPSRLEGHWQGVRAEGVPPEAQAEANAFAAAMRIDVKGGHMTVTTARETQSGRFRVVKETPSSIVIKTDKSTAEETFTFANDGTVRWEVSGPRAIAFQRR